MTHRRVRSVRQSRSPMSRDGYPCRNGETSPDRRGRKPRRRTTNSSIRNRHARSRPRLRRVPSGSPPLQRLAGSGNELLLLIRGLPIPRHPAPRALPSNHGTLPSTAPQPSIEGRDGRRHSKLARRRPTVSRDVTSGRRNAQPSGMAHRSGATASSTPGTRVSHGSRSRG